LKDLIESGCISVAKITQIYRQAAESKIIVNAHRINEGKMVETEVEKDRSQTSTSYQQKMMSQRLKKFVIW
jgi:ATP-dependent exoDNAse (exonuclease V) alpha subunit